MFPEGTPVFIGLSIKTVAAFITVSAYIRWRGIVPQRDHVSRGSLGWYLFAGVLNSAFLVFYYLALEIAPVSVVIPIVTTSPLIVATLSYLFLPKSERVTLKLLGAASIVVVGALIIMMHI